MMKKSEIVYASELPDKDDLLTHIIILKFQPSMIQLLSKLPVKWYTIRNFYLFIIPETKLTDDIYKTITFDGYLNFNGPIL